MFTDAENKLALIQMLVKKPEVSRAIIFTLTKSTANKVAEALTNAGSPAEAIHGNKSQANASGRSPASRPALSACWWQPISPPAASTWTTSARVQLRHAQHPRELRPPHRPHRAGRP